MGDDELREIEARAEAATPGPWTWDHEDDRLNSPHCPVLFSCDIGEFRNCVWLTRDDAAFIAQAREDVPRLVAEIRRLQGGVSR